MKIKIWAGCQKQDPTIWEETAHESVPSFLVGTMPLENMPESFLYDTVLHRCPLLAE